MSNLDNFLGFGFSFFAGLFCASLGLLSPLLFGVAWCYFKILLTGKP